MMPGSPHTPGEGVRHAWDRVWICAAALIVYVLLLQDRFVNEDAYTFLNTIGQGMKASSLHPLYGPVATIIADVLGWLGFSLYRSLQLASTVGVVVAVWFFHASTFYLGMSRERRNLAAGLVAATPGVVFFATVLEIPGLFLGFAAVAWWLAARYAQQPTLGRGILVGIASAVTSMMHQTGHPFAGLLVWLVARPVSRSRVKTS